MDQFNNIANDSRIKLKCVTRMTLFKKNDSFSIVQVFIPLLLNIVVNAILLKNQGKLKIYVQNPGDVLLRLVSFSEC